MATHSPPVAAQFEPWERTILEWGDDGLVHASKGTAPKGDDPSDLLRKDLLAGGERRQSCWRATATQADVLEGLTGGEQTEMGNAGK